MPFKLIKFFIAVFLSVFSQGYFGRPDNAASHRVDLLQPDPVGLEGLRDFSTGRARCEIGLPTSIFLLTSLIIAPLEYGVAAPGACRNALLRVGALPRGDHSHQCAQGTVAPRSISRSSVLGFGDRV